MLFRSTAGESALGRLLGKVFGGSPELLLTHLVAQRELTPAQVERMKRLLDERLEEEK